MRTGIVLAATASISAVLGFSYALATADSLQGRSAEQAAQTALAARALGQPLRFTNAFLLAGTDPAYPKGGQNGTPPGFDLGDVCYGTNFPWVRYLSATGGYSPYRYETRPNFDFTKNKPPLPTVDPNGNGRITGDGGTLSTSVFAANPGAPNAPVFVSGAIRFNALVTDFLGTQATGTFRLNVIPCPPTFRFANDRLTTAQLGLNYFTNLTTLSGVGAVKFSVASPVLVGGTSFQRLEQVGLALTDDGLLFGRPSIKAAAGAQTIVFTAVARDSTDNFALSRDGTQYNQIFTLNVENNTIANSEVTALQVQLAGDATGLAQNADSLSYQGVFDPKGITFASLAGTPFTFRLGRATYSGTFNSHGHLRTILGGTAKKKSEFDVNVSIGSGTIRVKISKATLVSATNLPLPVNTNSYTLPVVLSFEFAHYRACEALTLDGVAGAGKQTAKYFIGTQKSMAGGCQIVSISGIDAKLASTILDPGTPADRWKIRWMSVPRFAIDAGAASAFPVGDPASGTPASAQITISLGEMFTQKITAQFNSVRGSFRAKSTDPGINQLTVDGKKYLHSLETNPIVEGSIGLPQAARVTNTTQYKLGMKVTGYEGQCGRVIAPNARLWSQR